MQDDLLDPREWFNQHIGVVVTNRKPFSFWVDVWGYLATVPAPYVSIASLRNQ